MYSELVQVDRMATEERWKDGRLLSIFSNIPILLDTTSDTWFVDTEGRYRSSKWRPRSVWAHRQRLAPSFNAVTTRRGTQEVRLPDRVANYGERGRVQLRLDEINGEFSSIPWEISMPETGLGRNRNVLRLIRRESDFPFAWNPRRKDKTLANVEMYKWERGREINHSWRTI